MGSVRLFRQWAAASAFVSLLVATAPASGAAASPPPDPLPEVPVTAEDLRVQPANNSPVIAVDPTEGRFVAVANRLDNPDFACALHVSGDGGRTWSPAVPVPELPEGAEKCYAPEIAFDGEGALHYLFVALRGRGNEPMGVFLTTSSDRAKSFSAPRQVLGPENYQVRMVLDPTMGDSGRLHLVWLHATSDAPTGGLPAPPNPILAAHSDDGGKSFSAPVRVSSPREDLVVAPAMALGSEGSVHVLYYDLQDDFRDYQGLAGPTWPGRWSLVLSSSRDGGNSFDPGVTVDDGIVPPERVMVIFTMAPAALAADDSGRLFVAWHDARNGDWDVFLRRSTDEGQTWEDLVRVNDDPLHNGRSQYMPRLSVAPNGRLDTIFYDRRDDPDDVRNHVYFTFSTNGGTDFARNLRVTSQSSDSRIGPTYAIPSAKGLIEFGSRLGLFSHDSETLAAWTDTRNNAGSVQQDVFATEIKVPTEQFPWRQVVAASLAALVTAAGLLALRTRARRTEKGAR